MPQVQCFTLTLIAIRKCLNRVDGRVIDHTRIDEIDDDVVGIILGIEEF